MPPRAERRRSCSPPLPPRTGTPLSLVRESLSACLSLHRARGHTSPRPTSSVHLTRVGWRMFLARDVGLKMLLANACRLARTSVRAFVPAELVGVCLADSPLSKFQLSAFQISPRGLTEPTLALTRLRCRALVAHRLASRQAVGTVQPAHDWEVGLRP